MVAKFLQNNNIDITYAELPTYFAGMYVSIQNKDVIVINKSIAEESKEYYVVALSYFCIVKKEPNKILLNSSTTTGIPFTNTMPSGIRLSLFP